MQGNPIPHPTSPNGHEIRKGIFMKRYDECSIVEKLEWELEVSGNNPTVSVQRDTINEIIEMLRKKEKDKGNYCIKE